MWLTFDWDDVSPVEPKVIAAIEDLKELFGVGRVWCRLSSSKKGMHLVIGDGRYNPKTASIGIQPIEFEEDDVMRIREQFAEEPYGLECRGRLMTDKLRREAGTTWGRIFIVKNGNVSGEWEPC
jgi:hypothetical protein